MNELENSLPRTETGASQPSWVQRRPRIAVLGWLLLLVLGLYLIRLWQLQFAEQGFYVSEAQEQQLRIELILPQRGVIFDSSGELLVRNVPAYNIIITPGDLPDDVERERAVLQRLSQMIDVPYSNPAEAATAPLGQSEVFPEGFTPPNPGLLEMVDEVRYLDPYAPLVVAENVDREIGRAHV